MQSINRLTKKEYITNNWKKKRKHRESRTITKYVQSINRLTKKEDITNNWKKTQRITDNHQIRAVNQSSNEGRRYYSQLQKGKHGKSRTITKYVQSIKRLKKKDFTNNYRKGNTENTENHGQSPYTCSRFTALIVVWKTVCKSTAPFIICDAYTLMLEISYLNFYEIRNVYIFLILLFISSYATGPIVSQCLSFFKHGSGLV